MADPREKPVDPKRRALWPHLLRAAAMALAALALSWGIAGSEALAAAMLGAVFGVVAGQLLANSKLKLGVLVAGAVLLGVMSWLGASLATATEAVPRMVGPANALTLGGVLRFGGTALAVATALRAVAVRRPTALALELAFLVTSITAVFASHRDGVIARPLWLSDWAWREGFDPAQIFLGIGVVAVGLSAVLLLAETKSGRSLSSLLVLAALGILAFLFIGVVRPPSPDPIADLGLKVTGDGDEPPPPPPDASNGDPQRADGGGDPDAGKNDGGQGQDAGRDGGGQDGGLDGGSADGGQDGGGQDGGKDGGGADGGQDGGASDQQALDGGSADGGSADGGQDGGSAKQDKPQDSSQDQLDQQEGQRGAAAPVAVVILEDDYSPPSQAYYFREDALSQFNGARLVAGSRGDIDRDILPHHALEPTPVGDNPSAKGRGRVRAMVAMLTEHNRPFGLETPIQFSPAPNPNRQRFVRAYKFESLAQTIEYKKLFGKIGGNPAWKPDVLAYYTQAPTDTRYKELAQKVLAKLPPSRQNDPFAKALAVKLFLDEQLTYSTKARHAGAADPTAEMLFGDKTGYCVHFAHAAVFLWRSLGVPSRVGVGYRTEEDSRKGGSTILVRSGDAHAWPELYLDGVGWVILDISAAKNLDPPAPPPDDDLQKLLGEMARNQPPDPTEDPPQERRQKRQNFGRDLGIAGLLLLAVALVVLYCIKLWRRVLPVFVERSLPRVGYRSVLDSLAEAGLAREYGETRESFAKRVAPVAPSFVKLTAMHVAARMRPPPPEGAPPRVELQVGGWRETMRAVKREAAAGTKLWRRLLGLLNPTSFLDAK